jgi:hypothetical protein
MTKRTFSESVLRVALAKERVRAPLETLLVPTQDPM